MTANPQDVESLDFWIRHPVPDPFVMTLKGELYRSGGYLRETVGKRASVVILNVADVLATIILHRVTKFARKWKNRHLAHDDDLQGMQRPEFKELTNAIACLQ
jgi:hypothetical protein